MKATLSSPSCFVLCLSRSPGDVNSENVGSSLSLQTQGHHAAPSIPQTLCVMSEGDITVLPFGPGSLDLSKQEAQTLTRLYSMNGGYHLRILPDGTVNGGRQENDTYGEEKKQKNCLICDCWLYFKIRSQRLRARYEGEAFNFSFNIRLKVFVIVKTMVNKREWVNLRCFD